MILQHILLMIRCISALKWVHFTRESCSLFTTWHNEGKKLLAKNFGREIMQVNIKKIELYFLVMLLVMLFNEASFHLSFGSDGKFSWVFARMKTDFFFSAFRCYKAQENKLLCCCSRNVFPYTSKLSRSLVYRHHYKQVFRKKTERMKFNQKSSNVDIEWRVLNERRRRNKFVRELLRNVFFLCQKTKFNDDSKQNKTNDFAAQLFMSMR